MHLDANIMLYSNHLYLLRAHWKLLTCCQHKINAPHASIYKNTNNFRHNVQICVDGFETHCNDQNILNATNMGPTFKLTKQTFRTNRYSQNRNIDIPEHDSQKSKSYTFPLCHVLSSSQYFSVFFLPLHVKVCDVCFVFISHSCESVLIWLKRKFPEQSFRNITGECIMSRYQQPIHFADEITEREHMSCAQIAQCVVYGLSQRILSVNSEICSRKIQRQILYYGLLLEKKRENMLYSF